MQQWILGVVAVGGLGAGAVGDINVPGDYATIQAAIDAAQDGDEVVVAPGTYFETIDFLGKSITLRSSDGREVTTINGALMGTVVTCDSGETPDTVLEGFTITCGLSGVHGGGMRNTGTSPTVRDCDFVGNVAAGLFSKGGAIVNAGPAYPEIANCRFMFNHSDGRGGAIGNYNSAGPTVVGCTFLQNTADEEGGALSFAISGEVLVTGCVFGGNLAMLEGGAIACFEADVHVSDSLFCANSPPELFGCVDDGGNVFTDADICSEPGGEDPPEPIDHDPVEPAGAPNRVFVTHGWNTSLSDFNEFWSPFEEAIETAILDNGGSLEDWLVEVHEWADESGDLASGPGEALANAVNEGAYVGDQLGPLGLSHIHFVAHSAGAGLIGKAVQRIKTYPESTNTTIHTTFLDAYIGIAGSRITGGGVADPDAIIEAFQDLYGSDSTWSDHYYSREAALPIGLGTQWELNHAYNVDVTRIDPLGDCGQGLCSDAKCDIALCLSSHAWPRIWYKLAICGAQQAPRPSCVPDSYSEYFGTGLDCGDYGLPLSAEVLGSSWETVIESYPVGNTADPDVLEPPECTAQGVVSGGAANDNFIFDVRLDAPVDLTAVPHATSGNVVVDPMGFGATAALSEPAWINVSLDYALPVNFLLFDAVLEGDVGVSGMLTVYADGERVGHIEKAYAEATTAAYSFQTALDPFTGVHSVALRLDAFAGGQLGVSVSNLTTGLGQFVPVCPWDLDDSGDVGTPDFLDLLAQWGTDPGGPPDFDGDGTVGTPDFLELLANWGPCP